MHLMVIIYIMRIKGEKNQFTVLMISQINLFTLQGINQMKELFNVQKIDLVIKIVFSFSKGDDEHRRMYPQQDLVLLIMVNK